MLIPSVQNKDEREERKESEWKGNEDGYSWINNVNPVVNPILHNPLS
jgi:hypothetical protein